MYVSMADRRRRVRRIATMRAGVAVAVLLPLLAVFAATRGTADAAPAVAQTYYTPFEAQQYIGILRTIAADPGCCTSPVLSTISLTSGADGNTVYYDHFEDGYELDPLNPVQASTLVLALDAGDVWTQTSSVPVDVGGQRGPGNFYDGRDRISSTAPIAMTQTGYTTGAGTLLAGGVQVLDLDKSGLRYDLPAGQNADYNALFEYVGVVVVASANDTTVQIDADANGSFETTVTLDEGETHLVNGGIMLGAVIEADKPVSAYVATGDVAASYESRLFELYPTAIWSDESVSPVGAHSSTHGTRVFLFNPGSSGITVDVLTGTGSTSAIAIGARSQASYLMPVDAGARFRSQNGAPFYAFQLITTEGTGTSSYDWGYTLVPGQAATPSVIVPYAPGSEGNTNNYSPVWLSPSADTTLYVDRDGDPATGANIDAVGNRYDFSCAIGAYDSVTVYDDGTSNCYLPSQSSATGGDRDLTGARFYTLDGARLAAAWGQRPNYVAGTPALDMGTTILPFPEILITKSSVLSDDQDGDGLADAGDEILYTITMENLGIVDVSNVLLTDETPAHTGYVPGSVTLDGSPQADDTAPYSASPVDTDSPNGGLAVGTITAGGSRVVEMSVVVDTPIPFGVSEIVNVATMVTQYGPATATHRRPLDVPPLQIVKTSSPSASPVGSGDTITYTVQVQNTDDAVQTGVTVIDTLPAGTTYVGGSVAGDIDGTPVVVGPPPTLASGLTLDPDQLLTITFDVTVDTPIAAGTTEFRNTVAASSTQYPTLVEDDAADPAGPSAALSLLKVDDEVAPLAPGDPLVYTITVTNAGPDEAADVTVVDTLPAGVTFDPGASDPSCVEGPAGTITCSLGDLGITSTSFDIGVTVDAGVDGTMTNTATVSSPTPDPDPSDDSDDEDTVVDSPPAVLLSKTPSVAAIAEPGGPVVFTVEITNDAVEPVTITSLTDDVFGDLLDPGNPLVADNTCAALYLDLAVAESRLCSFEALVTGDASDPDHLDTITVVVEDDEGTAASAAGSATVALVDAPPAASVTKDASAASLPEPGGTVTFTITVSNPGTEAYSIVSLTDDVFGDLLDSGNPAVSANSCPGLVPSVVPGAAFACSFDADVLGDAAGPDHTDVVTLSVVDNEGTTATASDDAVIAFDDVVPQASLVKSASAAAVTEPGGTVTFSVAITNEGPELLTLDALDDSVFGDLLDPGNPAVTGNTCPVLASVGVGATESCSFDADLNGLAGDPDHVNVVTATLSDDDGGTVSPSDDAVVGFAPAGSTIGGLVFADLDRDGVRDGGETGLEGVAVAVTGSGGGSTVVTTGSGGTWSVAVLPGDATVVVDGTTAPAGWSLTTANESQVITAVAGSHVSVIDVGYGPPLGAVSGTLYLDLDGDPDRDPFEPPLEGLTVELLDDTDAVIDSIVSAADGSYRFDGLVAGAYTVRVVGSTIPAGLVASADPDGGSDGRAAVAVPAGEELSEVDFGHRGTATVGDTVWVDANEDGTVDDTEEAIEGAVVGLVWWGPDGIADTGDDHDFGTEVTDANGWYRFANLPPGSYTLSIDPDDLAVAMDPTTPIAVDVTLAPGQALTSADFGFVPEGTLPLTGIDAESLLVLSGLMMLMGGVVLGSDGRSHRRFRLRIGRI